MNRIYFSNIITMDKLVEIYQSPLYNDLCNILELMNKHLDYKVDIIIRLNAFDINCSMNVIKQILFFDDLILKLNFNKEDISAYLGHEFGHLYLHKNSYSSIYIKGTKEYNWDIEFNADKICVNILKGIHMNPNALKNLHQKVLKFYTLKDIADNNHPTLKERIDRL